MEKLVKLEMWVVLNNRFMCPLTNSFLPPISCSDGSPYWLSLPLYSNVDQSTNGFCKMSLKERNNYQKIYKCTLNKCQFLWSTIGSPDNIVSVCTHVCCFDVDQSDCVQKSQKVMFYFVSLADAYGQLTKSWRNKLHRGRLWGRLVSPSSPRSILRTGAQPDV